MTRTSALAAAGLRAAPGPHAVLALALALTAGCRTSDDLLFAAPGTHQIRAWVPFKEHQKLEIRSESGTSGRFPTTVEFGGGLDYELWLTPTQSFVAGISYLDMLAPEGTAFDDKLVALHAGGRAYALPGRQPVALFLQYGVKAGLQPTRANQLAFELGGGATARLRQNIALELAVVHELPILDGDNTTLPFVVQGDEYSWDGFTWRFGVTYSL